MSEAGPSEGAVPRQLSRQAGVLLLAMLGCAGPRESEGPAPAEAGGFTVVVNNRHPLDLNIFVQHDGQASRVAMVPATSTKSIVLSLWLLGQSRVIRIIAEPIGKPDRYSTDPLTVQPGQAIVVDVESQLSQSTYKIE